MICVCEVRSALRKELSPGELEPANLDPYYGTSIQNPASISHWIDWQ
ncbi:MAG: hypothetical protein KDA90_02180 [Planctomycetaceae bacterium]|nr:hypothetical protein [Planctomycetaceae bacterium]